jgi:hypothetical protein
MLSVHVPSQPSHLDHVAGASGIVSNGEPVNGRLHAYFEGNLFGAVNLRRWVDRVACAADRLLTEYPTTAKMLVAATDLTVVGHYDPVTGAVVLDGAEASALAGSWCGEWVAVAQPEQLLTERATREQVPGWLIGRHG